MDLALAQTIVQFSHYVRSEQPDLIIIHGDRLESLACSIVGSFNHILSAHVEGGELSGTLDESIRHSISKLAHLHYVCHEGAKDLLLQMGERAENIFVIGSSDIDVMLGKLPHFEEVTQHYYQLQKFGGVYAIFIYHPVTSEILDLPKHIYEVLEGLKLAVEQARPALQNFVVIYPNNDLGSEIILNALQTLKTHPHFVSFPSMKFECFLTLLKHAQFIVGNSSCGIREAGVYGVPCINIGTRQTNRSDAQHIINVEEKSQAIAQAIQKARTLKSHLPRSHDFGKGKSVQRFLQSLTPSLFETPTQKYFTPLGALCQKS